jgi:voltage-gated potassium channel Kch
VLDELDLASTSSTVHVYFSFATLTTVGYGDLTARTDLGRTLAVMEALLGQLYLVTVVSVGVANLVPRRRLDGGNSQ